MQAPINIAIIAGQLVVGGAERQLYLWLKHMDRARFNPAVITLHPGHDDYWESPIEALSIPLFRVSQSRNRVKRLVEILKILHPHRPQLIHGWHLFSGAYAALAARLLGARSMAGIRSSYQAVRGSLETQLVRWFAHALVANSETAAALYAASMKEKHQKVYCVRNAVVPEFEEREITRNFLSSSYPSPKEAVWLASMGRMERLKRFDILIEACAQLQQQEIPFHLFLVGDGPEKPVLQALTATLGLRQCITFTGEVPSASRWMRGFDIFCFPSLSEGSPNVVMEAAAAGLPVVAWDLPFNREVLPEAGMARLLAPVEPTAMADALKELIYAQPLRESLGAAAQAHVLNNFGLSKYVSSMTAVYEKVLGVDRS